MKTKYDTCHEKTMDKYMKKFEKGELKDRSNKKIKSRKQAVAIALSISDKKCEKNFSIEDYKKIEERFNKNIYDNENNNKVSEKKLSYTTFKNGLKLVDYYKLKGKKSKANNIFNSLLLKVFIDIKKGNINKVIINDMIKYIE